MLMLWMKFTDTFHISLRYEREIKSFNLLIFVGISNNNFFHPLAFSLLVSFVGNCCGVKHLENFPNQKKFFSVERKKPQTISLIFHVPSKSWLMNCKFLLLAAAQTAKFCFVMRAFGWKFIYFSYMSAEIYLLTLITHSIHPLIRMLSSKCIFNSRTHSSCESTHRTGLRWEMYGHVNITKWQYLNLFIYSSPKSSPFARA